MTEKHDAHTDSNTARGDWPRWPDVVDGMTHWHLTPQESPDRVAWGDMAKLHRGNAIDQGPYTERLVFLGYLPSDQEAGQYTLRVWGTETRKETTLTLTVPARIRVHNNDGYTDAEADR